MKANQFDVVVIGGGGAGLAAAATAAKLGCKVVLLEKNAALGGSTAWSVGSVTVTGSPHQRRRGIEDSCDAHFEDMGLFAGKFAERDNLSLRRILVDEAPAAFEWLLESGVVFTGPAEEKPHRVPRMHNVVPSSKAFPFKLGGLCKRLGVDIRLNTDVRSLTTNEFGRVCGAKVADAIKGEYNLQGKAVILATGDYSGASDLKSRFSNEVAAACEAVNLTSTGDGHKLAMKLGGRIVNADLVWGPILRFTPPPRPPLVSRIAPFTAVGRLAAFAVEKVPKALARPMLMSFITTALGPEPSIYEAGAVVVNADGSRFSDETRKLAKNLVRQPGGLGYILLDNTLATTFSAWPNFISTAPNVAYAYLPDYKRSRPDLYHQSQTIEGLASQLGMNSVNLEQASRQLHLGRNIPLKPPFIMLGPMKSYVLTTDGGMMVNDSLQVLRANKCPIAGLYAAGSVGQGGLILAGHGHHLTWAFVSGRRAARSVAREIKNA